MSAFADALRHVVSTASENLQSLILAGPSTMKVVMKTRAELQQELRSAHRDWNHCYKIRQSRLGIPTRRAVAESLLRVVMKAATEQSPMTARELLVESRKLLRSEKSRSGENRYFLSGILHRWQSIHTDVVV